MTYIENIFLCMVSPLLVAALCMGRRQLRFFLFCIAGMGPNTMTGSPEIGSESALPVSIMPRHSAEKIDRKSVV